MNIILKPFALLLTLFYNITASYGWAIILFALVVKVILFPFSLKGKKSMVKTTMLQGKVKKIQEQYANNKQKASEEMQKLYDKEGVKPMSGCLWSLVPLLILIPLYAIIRLPLQYMMDLTVDQVVTIGNNVLNWSKVALDNHWITQAAALTKETAAAGYNQLYLASLITPQNLDAVKGVLGGSGNPFAINFQFFGLNLAQIPQWEVWTQPLNWNSIGLFLMPIVSAAFSLLMSFVSNKTNAVNNPEGAQKMSMSMILMGPVMSILIGYSMPAGLCVYWIINSVLSIAQEILSGKLLKKDYEAAREAQRKQELLAKEEEKRMKAALAAERAKRIAEGKKSGKKKAKTKADKSEKPTGDVISASRVGLRAYARGRAYDPNRFGGVTEYRDPNAAIDEDAIEKVLEERAEKAERAEEEAAILAAAQAKVSQEMEALDGSTVEEVAEKIEEAHEHQAQDAEAEADALAAQLQDAEEELEDAWEDVTQTEKDSE